MKIKNDNGEEIEVFTADEMAAKVDEEKKKIEQVATERVNAVNKEWEDKAKQKDAELQAALAEKKKIEDDIAASNPQAANFKTLKETLDKKDADIARLSSDVKALQDNRVNDFKNGIIEKYAVKDEELKKKILHHFDKSLQGMPSTNQDEIAKKVEAAWKLSVNSDTPNPLDSVMNNSGGRGFGNGGGGNGAVEFTPREKALGAKLGITEQDYKTYGPRVKTKINNN